jgi:hypothetical protein
MSERIKRFIFFCSFGMVFLRYGIPSVCIPSVWYSFGLYSFGISCNTFKNINYFNFFKNYIKNYIIFTKVWPNLSQKCFAALLQKCLALPPTPTLNTCDKGRHRFIRGARLELIITAFLGFTFTAGKIVSGRF